MQVIENGSEFSTHEDAGSRERGTRGLMENLAVALAGGDTRIPKA